MATVPDVLRALLTGGVTQDNRDELLAAVDKMEQIPVFAPPSEVQVAEPEPVQEPVQPEVPAAPPLDAGALL